MAASTIKNVLLLGADGTLGPFILHQLLQGSFDQVTVLRRAGSRSPLDYPDSVKATVIPDDFPEDRLVTALTGQDAVILAIKASQVDLQKKIADACVKANVQRFIPADFGSCDSSTAKAQELVPLFKNKTELRDYLQQLARQHESFTWTALVAGHFFDWLEFVKIDAHARRVSILDNGDVKASYSTRDRIGEATRRVLELPDQTANRVLFIQSFYVDQNAIVAACEKATGSKWTVEKLQSGEYEREWVKKRDEGVSEAIDNLVWLEGVRDGNWSAKQGFAMDLLGLKDQDLDAVVSDLLRNS